jgi:ACS family hexuronate transporter-like MFS transporter
VTQAQSGTRFRWLVLAVFVLSTTINYLDRATLATVAPAVKAEFHLSNAEYGWIVNAFMLTYALTAPLAGMLVDRIGLNRAIRLAVGLWSCAGIATGFTSGLAGLAGCRGVLGFAEAGGIPAAGKAIHQYMLPAERALGNAMNQAAVSLGLILAPPIATAIAVRSGWRHAFIVTGVLGLLWIPLWIWVSRRIPAPPAPKASLNPGPGLLGDRRLWAFVLANALSMIPYSLWTNWTTLYLVDVQHMTMLQAAWYAWIPPVLAAAGGFAGGALSRRWMNFGMAAITARFRVCLLASALALVAAAIPLAPGTVWACVEISISFFSVAAFSVNMYSLPLDTFGGARAAFAVSMLTASAGAAGLISPFFGRLIDLHGYGPVMGIAAVMPLAGCATLKLTRSVE